LQPWARVDGRLFCRGKPIKDCELWLWPIYLRKPDAPIVSAQYRTRTDANGVFAFDRVAPGPAFVKPDLSPWEPFELTSAQHVPLVIKPGQTHKMVLNGVGRTVVGKAVLPTGRTRKMTWDYGLNYLIALKEGIPAPDGLEHFKDAWRRGWNETWDASREGDTYMNTLHKHFVKLNTDGTFRIEGVAPGKHQLVLRIYDAPQDTGCLVSPVATALVDIDVPSASKQGDLLDIGNVVVDLCAALKDGDPAPAFEARAVDGKTARLADYRGRVVLVVFWATWCSPCVAELPTLKAIHAEFANDARMVIVSLSLDKTIDPVRRMAERKQLDWVQGHLGDWSETDVPSQYGVSYLPAVYLIGPHGKILAQKIGGPEIRKQIEEALNKWK
jgi:peroxiredoxin